MACELVGTNMQIKNRVSEAQEYQQLEWKMAIFNRHVKASQQEEPLPIVASIELCIVGFSLPPAPFHSVECQYLLPDMFLAQNMNRDKVFLLLVRSMKYSQAEIRHTNHYHPTRNRHRELEGARNLRHHQYQCRILDQNRRHASFDILWGGVQALEKLVVQLLTAHPPVQNRHHTSAAQMRHFRHRCNLQRSKMHRK